MMNYVSLQRQRWISLFISNRIPDSIQLFLRILSELQVLCLSIKLSLDELPFSQNPLKIYLKDLAEIATLDLADSSKNFELLCISSIFLCLVAFVLFVSVIFGDHESKAWKKFIIFVKIILETHLRFAFLGITYISIRIINSEVEDNSTSSSNFTWSIFLLIFSIFFGIIAGMKLSPHTKKSKYQMRSGRGDVFQLFFKFLYVFLGVSFSTHWVLIPLCGLILLIQIETLRNMPFDHYETNQIFLGLGLLEYFWFMLSILYVLLGDNYQIMPFIYIIMIPLCFKVSKLVMTHNLVKYSSSPLYLTSNKSDFYKKISIIDKILNDGTIIKENVTTHNVEEILFFSMVYNHNADCKDSTCICKKKLRGGISFLKKNFLRIMFEKALEKYRNHPEIILKYAQHIISTEEEIKPKLIAMLHKCKMSDDYSYTILADQLLKDIQSKKLAEEKMNDFDISKLFTFHQEREIFKEEILKFVDNYVSLWTKFIERKDPIDKILKMTHILDKNFNKIKQKYETIISISPQLSLAENLIYGHYLSLLRNRPASAEKVMRKFINHVNLKSNVKELEEIDLHSLNSSEIITIFISLQSYNLGAIEFASPSIRLLGYNLDEIMEQKVESLLPYHSRENHQIWLEEYLNTGQPNINNKSRTVYLRNKNGTLSRANIYIFSIASYVENFWHGAFIRVIKEKHDFILINKQGLIIGMNPGMYQLLEMNNNNEGKDSVHSITQDSKRLIRLLDSEKNISAQGEDSNSFVISEENSNDISLTLHNFNNLSHEIFCKIKINEHKSSHEKLYLVEILTKSHRLFHDPETDFVEDPVGQFADRIPEFDRGQNLPDVTVTCKEEEGLLANLNHQIYIKTEKLNNTHSELSSDYDFENQNIPMKQELSTVDKILHSISVASSSRKDIPIHLENAIHKIAQSKSDRVLAILIVAHFFIAVGLLIVYAFHTTSIFEKIPKVFNVSTINFNRIYNLEVYIYWDNALTEALRLGYMDERLGYTGQDLFTFLFSFCYSFGGALIGFDKDIISSLEYFEPEVSMEFFKKLSIKSLYNHSEIKEINIFDYDQDTASAMIRLYMQQYENYTTYDLNTPDFKFNIVNNWNDAFLMNEYIYELVARDVNLKSSSVRNFAIINCIVIALAEAILFLCAVVNDYFMISKRTKFYDMLNHIGRDEIENHLKSVKEFKDIIKTGQSLESFNTSINLKNIKKNFRVNQSVSHIVTEDKIRKIAFASLGFFHMSVAGACIAIFTTMLNYDSGIISNVEDAVKTNNFLNRVTVVLTSLYEYMIWDGQFTIRNNDYETEWKKDYNLILESANFFDGLKYSVDSEFKQNITNILQGDLCTIMYAVDQCEAREQSKQGLLGVNSYVAEAARDLKTSYDKSGKTFDEIKAIMSKDSFLASEWIYWLYLPPAYQQLEGLLKQNVLKRIDYLKNLMQNLIILFCLCFLGAIYFIWYPSWKIFKNEREQMQRTFRIIPLKVILGNSYIKNYLINDSKGSLAAIKNKL